MRNDIEMRQVHHRHDSGFLPCQRTYKKQLLCKKWSFWWNMRWSTLTQKMMGCLIRFRHLLRLWLDGGWFTMSRCDICTIGMTLVFYPAREHIINNNSAENGPSAITWDGARWCRKIEDILGEKRHFLCIFGKFSVFLRAISHMYMPPMFLSFYHILIYPLLPDMAKYGVSTPTYDGAWLRRFFFQKKKTYPKNGDPFF